MSSLYLGRLIGFVSYLVIVIAIGLYWAIITRRVCEYPTCDLKGVLIKEGMDESQSHCSDFQKFSCGNQHVTQLSIFDEIVHNLNVFEEMIFTEPVDYNYYHFLRPVQEFYNLCMIPGDEMKIFYASEIVLRYSIEIKNILDNKEDSYQLEILEYKSRNIGFKGQSLFSLYLDRDHNNQQKIALFIGLPISPIFYDKMELTIEILKDYRLSLQQPFIRFYTYPILDHLAVELVAYHVNLSRIVSSYKSQKVEYLQTNADKLQKMFPYYDWKLLISKLYSHLNLKDTTIYVTYKGYFEKLRRLISKKQMAAIYMAYTNLIELYIYSMPVGTTSLPKEVLLAVSDRKRFCKNVVYTYFGSGINSYIIEKFKIKENKQEILHIIVDNIKKALETSIKKAKWMPDEAKKETIDKLHDLKARLSVSEEEFKELSDPFVRYSYYREVCVPNNIIDALTHLNRFNLGKNLELMHRNWTIFDKSTFPEFHGVVYDSVENMLIVPTSVLQFSAYDSDWPMSVNFAGIGTEISKVLISGLDLKGSNCVKNRNCKKWQNTIVKNFIAKETSCIKFIRSQSKEDDATIIKMMEDLSGVNVAFQGYEQYLSNLWKDDKVIEDLSDYSSKELFFLSYGSMYCSDDPIDRNDTTNNAKANSNGKNITTNLKINDTIKTAALTFLEKTNVYRSAFGCGSGDQNLDSCLIV